MYGKKIEAAKTPEAKAALARELLELAKKETDQAAKRVELEEAKRLAVEAQDNSLLVVVVKEIASLPRENLPDSPLDEAERLWRQSETSTSEQSLALKIEAIELVFRAQPHGLHERIWNDRIASLVSESGVVLLAKEAELSGLRIRYDSRLDGILDWVRPEDYLVWKTRIVPGRYVVVCEYAADHASAFASLFSLAIVTDRTSRPTAELRFRLVNTGQWPTYREVKIGEIAIKSEAEYRIVLRILQKIPQDPNMGIISLRSLRFLRK
ncbi:MAG: hypothetical protein H5T92_04355 [Synergistales bacterium]|nr:hypothetical protein [Synergistales bacterium]